MAKKRTYFWFIEPIDAQTNDVISNQLGEENFCRKLCADGINRNLWMCDHNFAQSLWDSRETLNLKLRIYSALAQGTKKSNRDLRPKNCTFIFMRRRELKKAV